MYNRYVPQPDGSFLRNRLQENLPETEVPSSKTANENTTFEYPKTNTHHPSHPNVQKQYRIHRNSKNNQNSVVSFLHQLIPAGFDTEDLLVVLLLLLMGGNKEDQNNALLTLALYLFL